MKRVAFVTGSARGLGVQTVRSLAQEGHNIVISYRNSVDNAESLAEKVEQYGVETLLVQGDVSNKDDCIQMVKKIIERFSRIDILVLNAGPYIFERKRMTDYSEEEWSLLIHGNLSSFFYLTKEVIPFMRQNHWGRIITFGFNHAGQAAGWKHRSVFAAAKVGLASLTRSVAEEEAEHGITVNMVCPGDIVGEYKEKTIADVRQPSVENMAPIGRPGTGEDISRVVSFLCSDKSDFITGSVIEVNGGVNVLSKRAVKNKEDREETK